MTLLIVFARLPFTIVLQPVFRALIWFLDPTLPIPTRYDITNVVLPRMVSECRDSVLVTLSTVMGATVTFDLWMSKKTDDILSVDLHYVCDKWMWHHIHLGLLAMNGQTRGVVVANKLKEIFLDFNLMGKLFAMVYDGGANLSAAKTEIIRLHGTGNFSCSALKLVTIYTTNCIAHCINNACNGAVLAAKAAKYQVNCTFHMASCLTPADIYDWILKGAYFAVIRLDNHHDPASIMHHMDEEEFQGMEHV